MTQQFVIRFVQGAILCCVSVMGTSLRAQGTVNFAGWAGWNGTSYRELGMRFQLVIPPGATSYDVMGVTVGGGNTPRDGTAFMLWFRQYNPNNYVSLSLTDNSLFGLASVWLADPTGPSPSPVSISFVGHLVGGATVTNTFTTPGNGATTFAAYTFNPDFSSPVFTHVDILAPRWAMDNLVFTIPEPSAFAIAGLGVLAWMARMRKGIAGEGT